MWSKRREKGTREEKGKDKIQDKKGRENVGEK